MTVDEFLVEFFEDLELILRSEKVGMYFSFKHVSNFELNPIKRN